MGNVIYMPKCCCVSIDAIDQLVLPVQDRQHFSNALNALSYPGLRHILRTLI